MKKTIKILILLLLPFYSAFGLGQIGISIHDTTLVVGETSLIPIYADSSFTGQGVSSFNLQLSFDDYYLTVDSINTDGTLTSGWGTVTYNANFPEILNIAGANGTDLTGSGILLYVRVTPVHNGGTYLTFTDTLHNFFNEGTPRILLDDGHFSISQRPYIEIQPDVGIITTGETIQFYVDQATPPYTWGVTNNSVASIDNDGLLTGLQKGLTKITCQDANGLVDTTNDFIEVRAFRLTTRDTSFYQGNTVDIPVYSTDLTGLNYTSGEIELDLDDDILTPTSIITTGSLLSGYNTPQFSFRNDLLTIAFAGSTPLSGSGILFTIRFQISSDNTSGTYIHFNSILFNETDFGNGTDSYFDVLPLPNLTISPNTAELIAGESATFTATNGTPPYSWSVSNPSLASITSDGVLTALKGGVVTVHANDTYGGNGTSGNIYLYDTEVTVPDTTVEIASTIDLPIIMGTLDNSYSVVSLQTEVLFDSSKVKFNNIITSGTATNGWTFSINNQGNHLIIAGAGSVGFNAAGTIVKLRFTATTGAVIGNYSNINLENFLFNEGSPNAKINNGRITIAESTTPPVAPSNLSASTVSSDSIYLSWIDNSDNEDGFKVNRSLLLSGGWAVVASLSQNTNSFFDYGLTDGTKYYYKINAFNSVGNSPYSNVDSTVTNLNAPTNLDGVLIAPNHVNLTWIDNSQSEEGYIIERHEYTSSFYVLDTVGSNITSYIDSNLAYGEYYTYRVHAFNALTVSDYSNTFDFVVNNPYPNPPSDLTASALDSASVELAWNDNSLNEDGFIVNRSLLPNSGWAQVRSLPSNTTSYIDTGLTDGTKYFYKINAYNTAGNSDFSNIDSAITTMRRPTNLIATNPATNRVVLTWNDNSQNEDGYIIERHDGPNTGGSMLFNVIDTVGANVETYTDSNFTTETDYVYIIRGYNSYTVSSYSNEANVSLVGVSEDVELPAKFELFQNYPNPFNPSTVIKYSMPENSSVSIVIYSLLGQQVATLFKGNQSGGYHEITWDASNVPSGVYLIYIKFRSSVSHRSLAFTKKAILLK